MSAIEIKNLTYVYSPKTPFEKVALSDINLSIEEGQFVGIVGATGSGKSTLIQHLNGLVKVQDKKKSSVIVNGMSATDKKTLKNLRFEVGMVFQYPEYQLFADTVEKDVAFGPKNMKLEKDEIDRRVRCAIEVVGLDYDTFAHRSPFDLSGGENVVSQLPASLPWSQKFSSSTSRLQDLIRKAERRFSPLSKNFKKRFLRR